jgi:hypothetical protein
MSENKAKLCRSWSIGDLKIIEWEKYNRYNTKYNQYSLTKTEYEKPKNQGERGNYKTIFSISLDKKEDLIAINHLLTKIPQKELKVGSYSFSPKSQDPSDNRYVLTKEYEINETHEIKHQIGIISAFEILVLRELVKYTMDDILVTLYINTNKQDDNNSWNPSNERDSAYDGIDTNDTDDRGFIDRVIDDEIPF